MAKYGKNNYFDGVILPEPKEEMLRRMAKGVKMGYNQYVDKSASTMFKSPSMPIGTNDFTLEYFGNLYGAISSNTPLIFNANAPYTYSKGCLLIYGTPQFAVRWIIFEKPSSGDLLLDSIDLKAGAQESILHLALTRKGTTVKVYINGELKATKKQSAVKDLGDFRLGMANSSEMVMSRIYNYALSAEEVAAHYNDGYPAGYVLSGAYKRPGNIYVSNFTTSTEQWTTLGGSILTYDEANHVLELDSVANRHAHMFSPVSYDTRDPHVYDIEVVIDANPKVTRCDFYPYTFTDPITLPVEYLEETTVFRGVYIPRERISFSGNIYCYFRLSTSTIVRVRSIRVLPVGCIAEYLPQNLIPTAEGSVVQWLDSAPQLPEANGILPPLDASVGGYDLAAIGNPKIII